MNDFDKNYWEWLCSLHTHDPFSEKYDPLRRHCQCGYSWYFNKLHYMRMIIFDGLTVTCPRCQRKHRFKLSYHAIEVFDDVRKENTELENKRKELYWRG